MQTATQMPPGLTERTVADRRLSRSNSLAHQLIRREITRGTQIGLCLERSPEVVVGLPAIL
jgi:non-ribosomal peptide synthetase component F